VGKEKEHGKSTFNAYAEISRQEKDAVGRGVGKSRLFPFLARRG